MSWRLTPISAARSRTLWSSRRGSDGLTPVAAMTLSLPSTSSATFRTRVESTPPEKATMTRPSPQTGLRGWVNTNPADELVTVAEKGSNHMTSATTPPTAPAPVVSRAKAYLKVRHKSVRDAMKQLNLDAMLLTHEAD